MAAYSIPDELFDEVEGGQESAPPQAAQSSVTVPHSLADVLARSSQLYGHENQMRNQTGLNVAKDVFAGLAQAGQGLHNAPYYLTGHGPGPKNIDFLSAVNSNPNEGDRLIAGAAQYAPYGLAAGPGGFLKSMGTAATYGATQSANPLMGALENVISNFVLHGVAAAPQAAGRLVKAGLASPEGYAGLVNKELYNQAVHEPEAKGAYVHTKKLGDYLIDEIGKIENKTSPLSAETREALTSRLNKTNALISPSDAQEWVRSLYRDASFARKGNPASPEPRDWVKNKHLATKLEEAARQLEDDFGRSLESQGFENAGEKFKAANKHYREQVVPLEAHPVNKIGLGIQLGSAIPGGIVGGPLGALGSVGSALGLPHLFKAENPLFNTGQRFLKLSGGPLTLFNTKIIDALRRILPGYGANQMEGQLQ